MKTINNIIKAILKYVSIFWALLVKSYKRNIIIDFTKYTVILAIKIIFFPFANIDSSFLFLVGLFFLFRLIWISLSLFIDGIIKIYKSSINKIYKSSIKNEKKIKKAREYYIFMFKSHMDNLDYIDNLKLKKKYLDKQKEINLLNTQMIKNGYNRELYKKFLVVLSEYNDLYDEILNNINKK